jgi:beta-glucosidase
VLAEIEPNADAILVSFNVQHQALLDIISGQTEPSALLPMQMPADMKTVEEQLEDVPRDMRCYQDADGHTYDLAFGLNWSGIIDDARVKKYKEGCLLAFLVFWSKIAIYCDFPWWFGFFYLSLHPESQYNVIWRLI